MINKISRITDELAFKLNRKRIKKDSESLKIPYFLLYFLIYIEDKRFYYHIGIDPLAISRAFIMNKRKCKLQGGSTLVQQLYDVRQEKKGCKRERNFLRKLKQAYFGLSQTLRMSKKNILLEYLENIYLGKNYYGINKASNLYFQKKIEELTKVECFILIERIATPNRINLKRIDNILKRDIIKKVLSESEILELKKMYFKGEIYG